jgi:hypothetical protein
VHDVGVAEDIPQKTEARNDRGVTEVIRSDINNSHGKGVTPLCSFDVHRARERVNEVEVNGSYILGGRGKSQIGIKSVAGLKDEKLILLYRSRWLDVGMITIEAMRIVFAMLSGLSNDNGSWTLHIARIRP